MRRAFPGLPVRLQTVARLLEQARDGARTDAMVLPGEGGSQLRRTLTGPAQRRFGLAAGRRLDEGQQRGSQQWIGRRERPPAPTRPTDLRRGSAPRPRRGPQIAQARVDGRPREPRRPRHDTHPAMPEITRLRGRPLSAAALIQFGRHNPILAPDACRGRRLSHALL